jgi:protein-S-isoprenylcysteine O-methyltransferase Ste14
MMTTHGGTHDDIPDGSDSLGSLVTQLTTDLGTLTRQELALARAELTEEAKKAAKAGTMFGVATVCGWMVALFASLALMWALGEAMHLGWAALIVTAIWAIGAAVSVALGRSQMSRIDPKPDQTIDSLKEDKKWLTGQKN